MKQTDVLVYTGGARRRTISVEEFKAVNVTAENDLEFTRPHGLRVKVGDAGKEVVEYLLEAHGNEFKLLDADTAKEQDEAPVPPGTAPVGNGNPPSPLPR